MADVEDYDYSQDSYDFEELEEQQENDDFEYLEALLEEEEGDCCHTRQLPAFWSHHNPFFHSFIKYLGDDDDDDEDVDDDSMPAEQSHDDDDTTLSDLDFTTVSRLGEYHGDPFMLVNRGTFERHLMAAAVAGDVTYLYELFRPYGNTGRVAATSRQIKKAFRRAAENAKIEACRFLLLFKRPSYEIDFYRTNDLKYLDPIKDQLTRVVCENDSLRLCELLLLEDKFGHYAATDDDIETALRHAVIYEDPAL
jgi:hypothetical protein